MQNALSLFGRLGPHSFFFALVLLGLDNAGLRANSKPRFDRFGDAIPDGAVARLGTVRWRFPQPVELVQFLNEGKHLLVCCGDGIIHILDANTGKKIRHFGNPAGCLEALSPDGATLAQITPTESSISGMWPPARKPVPLLLIPT
jgi:hypothetical protein